MVTAEQRALAAAAEEGAALPPVDVVWDALAAVPDPEIPAISIVELGMVRAVGWHAGRLRVEVTPTYSGCPATDVIAGLIRERLAAIGCRDVDVVMRLSPPWTTDWMTAEAKAKLAAYGIAPPQPRVAVVDVAGVSPKREGGPIHPKGRPEGEHRSAQREGTPVSPLRRAPPVPCPRCGSPRTALLSQFGSTACKALYRCEACREPFDYFKPH